MEYGPTRSMCHWIFANESESSSDTAKNLDSGGLSHQEGAGGRLMVEMDAWVRYGLVSSMSSMSESCGVRNASADTRGDCGSSIVALVCDENEQGERRLFVRYITYQ